jgi:predicted acetyltransferase
VIAISATVHALELRDGELELAFAGVAASDPAFPERLTYHFTMESNGETAGAIRFRDWSNEDVDLYAGNFGYNVDETYRGCGFAERACRLLLPLVRSCGFERVWITCDPENWASRRTCERLGAELVEIIDLPEEIDMYKDGERQKCRYLLRLTQARLPC